jgi:UDP-N-acetylglucosamine/UDP-N-acetylgalactosamine diphosphorylase
VGPCRIAYGTLIAAGSVYRKDQLKADQLLMEGRGRGGSVPYSAGIYRNVKRQALNNIIYMGNLVALLAWYTHVRRLFIGERFPQALYDGLVDTLHGAISERILRFTDFCEKLNRSNLRYQAQMGDSASAVLVQQKDQLYSNRDQAGELINCFINNLEGYSNKPFLTIIRRTIDSVGASYIHVIKKLDVGESRQGSAWLQRIVDEVVERMLALFPSIR